jgi:hypothetical protein
MDIDFWLPTEVVARGSLMKTRMERFEGLAETQLQQLPWLASHSDSNEMSIITAQSGSTLNATFQLDA